MVEHDQIVTAEAHRDRLTALGERRASTNSAFIEAHAQPGDRAEEGQVLDRAARMYHVRSNSQERRPPTTENSALFDAASGASRIERHRLLAATALACRCRWNGAVFPSNWRPSGMSVELYFVAASSMFAPKIVGGDRS
jgi:hypothetical protein